MFKYRIGLNEDPESNAMAHQIESLLVLGKTVRVGKLSGIVEAVAWPMHDGKKDRTGWSILLMNHGNPFRILYRVLYSLITKESYAAFGWGDVEITDREP